jgi:outer membrane protein
MNENNKKLINFKNMRTLSLFTALFLFSQVTFTQEKRWTLGDCIQYAIEHSQSIERQSVQNEIYKQNLMNSIINQAPDIRASVGAQSNYGRSLDYSTNTYINVNTFSNNNNVSASMPLFAGFSYLNTTRHSNIMRKMGRESKQEIEDNVSLNTIESFYNVIYYQAMVNLAHEQLKESEENLRRMQQMESLGMKGKADLAEVEAKKAEDQYKLVRQQNLLRTMTVKLKDVMFFPIEDELEIEATMPEILVMQNLPDNISSIYESAKENLPAARALDLQLQGAKADYAAIKGSLFPTLSLSTGMFAGYNSSKKDVSFENQLKDNLGKYVGFSLQIPIFNNNVLGTKARISKQNYYMAQIRYNEDTRKLQNDIQQAVLDMEGTAEEFFYAQLREKSSDLAYMVNKRKYEEGLLSIIELYASSNQLLMAKAEKIRTQLDYVVKKHFVDYYSTGIINIEN